MSDILTGYLQKKTVYLNTFYHACCHSHTQAYTNHVQFKLTAINFDLASKKMYSSVGRYSC